MDIELKLNEVRVSEVVEFIKEFKKGHLSMMDLIGDNMKEQIQTYLSNLINVEFDNHLKRSRYERIMPRTNNPNHRNGFYKRRLLLKSIGETLLKMPRDRNASFKSEVVPKFQRIENAVKEDISLMYLTGISTRSLAMLSKRLIGKSISPQEVSNATKLLIDAVENWRTRDLSIYKVKYMYIDGVNFQMRIKKSVRYTPVLVAIGVNELGYKFVLSFQAGDKEL